MVTPACGGGSSGESSEIVDQRLLCDPPPLPGIFITEMTRTLTTVAMQLADADAVVSRAQRGDPVALEKLYRAYAPATYNLARRICRTTEDAEDVLQETFYEVCRSIRNYRGDGSIWGWIRTVASSKALMRLRRNKYRDTDELNDELAPARHASPALRLDLEAALDRLSPTARAVVWLHDVEGFTHEEIANQMGKSVSFSKSQLARAHQRLRLWLDGGVA